MEIKLVPTWMIIVNTKGQNAFKVISTVLVT